jgi:hypothetical protein
VTRDEVYLGGPVVREFPYRATWGLIVFCTLFFGVCAAVLGVKAATNDRGAVVVGLIDLGPHGATFFYWLLAAGSVVFTALSLLQAWVRLASPSPLVVTEDGVYVPRRPFLRHYDFAAFPRITALSDQTINRQRFLYIYHDGRKCGVVANMLPAKSDLDALVELIRQRTRFAEVDSPKAPTDGGSRY